MKVRQITVDDKPRLVEMSARFIAETPYARFGSEPEALERLVDVVLEHGAGFVAETDDGRIVGMIGYIVAPQAFTGTLYASELVWWMEPEHRGAGIRLLAVGEDWATRLGLSSITMIAPHGTELHKLYARRGYIPVETTYLKGLEHGGTDDNARDYRPERSRGRGDGKGDRGEEGEGRGG